MPAARLTLEEFAQLSGDGVRHEISEGKLITTPGTQVSTQSYW
jgi:hypothetical protein